MRAAFSMTINPDGAMHDWVDLPPPWSPIRIPTQDAVLLLGVPAYQDLLVDVAERERPALLVVHPPYDHLDAPTADRIRRAGTRVVAYAFDDALFAADHDAAWAAARERIFDRYATTSDVLWATAPLPPIAPREPPDLDAVLVGRAYQRRRDLVAALADAGLRVGVRGDGWPDGPVSRAEMLDLYARAAVVVTTADWESMHVPMVKHRLLDTAMLGAFQVAQEAPDLRRYFPPEEVPSFSGPQDLVARIVAALEDPAGRRQAATAARARALREHTWTRRFPDLVAGLDLRDRPAEGRSALLDQALLALAHGAEVDGRFAAAAALFAEAVARRPDDVAAHAGLGRCLRDLGRPDEAIPHLERAVAGPHPPMAAVHCAQPHCGIGTGLGRLGLSPPAAEAVVHLVALLVESGRQAEALALLDHVDHPTVRRAVARTIALAVDDEDDPLAARLREWRGAGG